MLVFLLEDFFTSCIKEVSSAFTAAKSRAPRRREDGMMNNGRRVNVSWTDWWCLLLFKMFRVAWSNFWDVRWSAKMYADIEKNEKPMDEKKSFNQFYLWLCQRWRPWGKSEIGSKYSLLSRNNGMSAQIVLSKSQAVQTVRVNSDNNMTMDAGWENKNHDTNEIEQSFTCLLFTGSKQILSFAWKLTLPLLSA